MGPAARRAGAVCLLALAPWIASSPGASQGATPFAAAIDRLSEPGGAFDADNLVSNEASYLDVVPALIGHGVRGGAYIGVGPDQNFSYIARIRPAVAYIIDIRRDNLLLHLLFKAVFAEARTRADYLSLLTGRPAPLGVDRWKNAGLEEIVAYVDRSTPWLDAVTALRGRIDRRIEAFGLPLSRTDRETIDRFHRTFVGEGLDLVFAGRGAPQRPADPVSRFPTFRQLLLAEDPAGRRWNYLATEDDFLFVQSLQAADAIIPVVGDVAGPRAMKAIGTELDARRLRVSAFYISNVDFYLARDGASGRFLDNLAALPRDATSVVIRSIFNGGSSASIVEPIDRVLEAAGGRR